MRIGQTCYGRDSTFVGSPVEALLCPDFQFCTVPAEGTQDEFVQAFSSGLIVISEHLAPHTGFPETANMVRDAFGSLGLIGLRLEEVSNIVRHLDEMVNIHKGLALGRRSLFEQFFLALAEVAVLLLPL